MHIAMRIRIVVLILFACLSWSLGSWGNGAGDAAHFMRDGFGARGRAMGSAQIASAGDYAAALWNPAPMTQTVSSTVGASLESRLGGLFTFSALGGAIATETVSYGAVAVTSDLYTFIHGAIGLGWRNVSGGVGARYYRFGVPGDHGVGLGLDAGGRFCLSLGQTALTVAAVSRDIGWTSIRWTSLEDVTVDRVSWVNRLGVAAYTPFVWGHWLAEIDLELSSRRPPSQDDADFWEGQGETNLSLGAEFRWAGISLRVGLQRYPLDEPDPRFRATLGLGIALDGFAFDLALIPSHLGDTYVAGFQVDL